MQKCRADRPAPSDTQPSIKNNNTKEVIIMARERMVTRTVEEAEVEVLYVFVSTQEVGKTTLKISATVGQDKALAYIQKHFQTTDMKFVAITSYTVHEILYGMPEQEFIANAKILPPRTTTDAE